MSGHLAVTRRRRMRPSLTRPASDYRSAFEKFLPVGDTKDNNSRVFQLFLTAILTAAFLLYSGAVAVKRLARAPAAPAKRAVISNVRAVAGRTSCTLTWDTDEPSDSLADLGTGIGPWIPALSQLAVATTDTAAPGVTSHTATISTLWPGIPYYIYLRSRPFSHGALDTNPADSGRYDSANDCNRLKDGSACRCLISPTSPNGSTFDFKMQLSGTQNVVQGYDTYLLLAYSDITRPMGFAAGPVDVTIGGLPPHSTLSIYDANSFIISFDSGTNLLKLKPSTIYDDTALHIVTTGSTPLGAYTITLNNAHAERYPSVVHDYSYTLSVTAPSFPSGTPLSYPPIPSIGDKNTPGTWVYGMVTKGASAAICRQNGITSNFYDAIRAYQQTQAYDAHNGVTGDPAHWDACISNRETGYLSYINEEHPPGAIWSIYLASNGMMNLALGGDSAARTGLFETADNAPGRSMRPALLDVAYERELDFITEAFIAANKAGDSKEAPLIPVGIDYLLADVDQIVNAGVSHEPFLDGAIADTLIHYYTDNGSVDVRVPIAVKALADHLWVNYWIPGKCSGTNQPFTGCFAYSAGTAKMGINVVDNSVSNYTNLNLMIAPMYAWLFKMTGNGTIPGSDGSQCGGTRGQPCTYQQAGDSVFASGVRQSDYYFFKDWAQNFRWSFDFVKWRSAEQAARK